MLLHYVSLTLRRLRRQPTYSAINVLGLVLGLACALVTGLYVRSELSFDRMHADVDEIFRVETIHPQNGNPERWASAPAFVADEFHRLPAIEHSVRVMQTGSPLVARTGTRTRFYEDRVYSAEASFFDVFDFEIVHGSAAELDRPHTAVLSEAAARRYFGDEDPIGASISLFREYESGSTDYEVIGIMADMPDNVHAPADILLSNRATLDQPQRPGTWISSYTYVRLADGVSESEFAAQLKETIEPVVNTADRPEIALATIPLTRIHLYSTALHDIVPQSSIRYVYLFSAIALLVLLIACINYVNLATALASQRGREVGVRKTSGALQSQLVRQFLGEAVAVAVLAAAVAILLASATLPAINAFTDKALSLGAVPAWFWAAFVLGVVLVGLAAGAYPAQVLARFRPAIVLKGRSPGTAMPPLLKVLTIAQFAISIGLILSTVVIQRQLNFVQQTNLGYDNEQLLIVRTRSALPVSSAATFEAELESLRNVTAVARANGIPGEPSQISGYDGAEIEDFDGEWAMFDVFVSDEAYPAVLGLDLVAGRLLDADRGTDREQALLLNETAVRELGWGSPADALGKRIGEGESAAAVVGVVRDFHYRDMREEIGSAMIRLSPDVRRYYLVRFSPADIRGLLADLEGAWNRFIPDQPFDYTFADDDLAAMYREETRLGQLFAVFSALAICIACLGLFGLTAYTVQRRTKEIGIRKVLGASAQGMLLLLSKDILWMLLAALVVGGVPAYLLMREWLTRFAYRAPLGWETVALAAVVVLAVALVAMSYHVLRASRARPVESLRYE